MLVEYSSKIFRWLFPAVWREYGEGKFVCLTFDDGPVEGVTSQVLDILDKYSVKATFFCVGDNVRQSPDLFSEIKSRGHSVGNHTMHHIKGFEHSIEGYVRDVEEANVSIKSRLFRPPYGRIRFSQLLRIKKNYRVIMWDVITRDYNQNLSPEKCLQVVKKHTKSGSIIVFHDSVKAAKNMLYALPKAIEWLKAEGYEFRLIDER